MASDIGFRFVIHGGAGVMSKEMDGTPYYAALKRIVRDTYNFASTDNTSAVDIVEFAVKLLEDEPLFNAGCGAVYTSEGVHELEASIMNGINLECGAASLITCVKNPISVARLVMEKTIHNYVIGPSVEKLAAHHGLEQVTQEYYHTEKRKEQLLEAQKLAIVCGDHLDNGQDIGSSKGTVGCVCMKNGHVAAATSTGGMTNKRPGRVGDTPIIGAGTYADDRTCAVSGTGHGEVFMKHVAAHDVSSSMKKLKMGLLDAVKSTVYDTLPADSGGIIAVDPAGNFAMEFNCSGMFRGMCGSDGQGCVGIWEESVETNFKEYAAAADEGSGKCE